MENEKDKSTETEKTECSCQSCSPEESQPSCCGPGKPAGPAGRFFKSAVFYAVIIAAAIIAINSISAKSKLNISKEPACGMQIPNIQSLNNLASEKDFIFVMIPEQNGKIGKKLAKVMDTVKNNLENKGVRAGVYTLDRSSDDFKSISDYYDIKNYPAVIAMGKSMGSMIVKDGITEEKLMNSFNTLLSQARCTPSPGSKCCPK